MTTLMTGMQLKKEKLKRKEKKRHMELTLGELSQIEDERDEINSQKDNEMDS